MENEEFVKEIQDVLRSKKSVINIHGLRNQNGNIEFALEVCYGNLEWFPLHRASKFVQSYIEKSIKLGVSIS